MASYYMAPWEWLTDPEDGACWARPEAIGCLDLRPLAACAMAGGLPQGLGLFVLPAPDAALSKFLLAESLDAKLTALQLTDIANALKCSPLTRTSLLDVLVELLTTHADPTQSDRTSCIMPKQSGMMDIHLAGQMVWERRFGGESDPAWPNIQQVVQATYRETRQRALDLRDATPGDLHRKRLTDWQRKFGISDHTKFIPADLPDEKPALPHTTITESFDKENSGTLGPDLTWTETSGDHFSVSSNKAVDVTGAGLWIEARAESDLSTDDHYCQAEVTWDVEADSSAAGVAVRFNASAQTFYQGDGNAIGNLDKIRKVVAGTRTTLQEQAHSIGAETLTVKLQADGTALTLWVGATETATTDANISGNTRCGITSYRYTAGHKWDALLCADLAAVGDSAFMMAAF